MRYWRVAVVEYAFLSVLIVGSLITDKPPAICEEKYVNVFLLEYTAVQCCHTTSCYVGYVSGVSDEIH